MKNEFKDYNDMDYKKLIDKFFHYGVCLIIAYTFNILFIRDINLLVGKSLLDSFPRIMNIYGLIYNLTNLLIPVLLIINLKYICNIIYIFILILRNKDVEK
ncbi:hypothetical protein [Clostridium senegalense]|uniref:Uncharacterized protein n=1 Tax=Clostridium senegalense TaxID=1465809 RepID=A0A6M0H0G9_9CLOT|nr:hypothetical protein [Clostridium senegalense]NEU03614.1 hypothetical protein [Clostridium senegalense]